MTDCDLMIFPENGELSSLSGPGFDVIVYSIPTQRLEQIADALEIPSLPALLDRDVVRLDRASMAALRQQALACADALGAVQDKLPGSNLRQEICRNVAREILGSLARCTDRNRRHAPTLRERSACMARALEMIADCGSEGLTVRKISSHARASERTLQYAFQEQFGMSPKAFLQAWRLNQVRRELTKPSRHTLKITDAANRYGFWHMGQFAADYRRMFGELPSNTLAHLG